jgi:hypothetical protein
MHIKNFAKHKAFQIVAVLLQDLSFPRRRESQVKA